jgi:hypothetical protein
MQLVMSLSEVMVFNGWIVMLVLARGVLARTVAPIEEAGGEPLRARRVTAALSRA